MTTVSGEDWRAAKAISKASLRDPALCSMLAKLNSGICYRKYNINKDAISC